MGNLGRSALVTLVSLALLVVGAGCGGGGDDGGGGGEEKSDVAAARESDAEVVNVALSQELTLTQVYRHSLPLLKGEARAIARQFLSQEEEHIDGVTKVLRGLQAEAEGEVEEVDYGDVVDEEDALLQLYEITNLQVKHFIDDVAHLEGIAPRALISTMAANEAQHLTILRQLLGADRAESVPEAFDGGEVPPPVENRPPNRG